MTKWIAGIILALFISALVIIGCKHQVDKAEVAAPPKTEAAATEKTDVASEQKKDADSLARVDNASKNSSGTVSDSKEKDAEGKKSAKKTLPGDQFSEVMGKPTTTIGLYNHNGDMYEPIVPEIALVSYKVAAGDTLCKILWRSGMRPTESRCKRLAAINKLENVGKRKWWIYEGSTLEVPKPYFVRQTKVGINPTKTTRKEALEIGMKRTVTSLAEIEIKFDMPSSFLDGVPVRIVGPIVNINNIVASSATFGRGVQGWTQTDIKSLKKTLKGPSVFLTAGDLGFLIVEATACRNIYIIPFRRIGEDEKPKTEEKNPKEPDKTPEKEPEKKKDPVFSSEAESCCPTEVKTTVGDTTYVSDKDSGNHGSVAWIMTDVFPFCPITIWGQEVRYGFALNGELCHGKDSTDYVYNQATGFVGPVVEVNGDNYGVTLRHLEGYLWNKGKNKAYSSEQEDRERKTMAHLTMDSERSFLYGFEADVQYTHADNLRHKATLLGAPYPQEAYNNNALDAMLSLKLFKIPVSKKVTIVPTADVGLGRSFGQDDEYKRFGPGFKLEIDGKQLCSVSVYKKEWDRLSDTGEVALAFDGESVMSLFSGKGSSSKHAQGFEELETGSSDSEKEGRTGPIWEEIENEI